MIFQETYPFGAFYSPDGGSSFGSARFPGRRSHVNYSLPKDVREDIIERVENAALNEAQREAVEHLNGPRLVLSGAGTGKTRVITHRIANLVGRHRIRPRRILAVTFTNKAAKEMKERAQELLGDRCKGKPTVKTLHSLCSNIIRVHYKLIGYQNHVEIVSNDDPYQEHFLRMALLKLPWGVLEKFGKDPHKELAAKISLWKNELLEPKDVMARCKKLEMKAAAAAMSNRRPPNNPYEGWEAYEEYETWLKRGNMMDCDDLLRYALKILNSDKDVRRAWQNRYDHILVDEYQDTNTAQYEILKALAEVHKNIFVVGDDDQSIYGWRAANVELIRKFPVHWEEQDVEVPVTKLLINYRCTQPILDLSNNLMHHEAERHQKDLIAHKKGGDTPIIVVFKDELEEAREVINDAVYEKHGGKSVILLFRTQAGMKKFRPVLNQLGEPYEIWGSEDIRLGEVKQSVLALLALLHDPEEKAYALMPLLKLSPVKLPDSDFWTLSQQLDRGVISNYWQGLKTSKVVKEFSDTGRERAFSLVEMIESLHAKAKRHGPRGSLTEIAKEGIQKLYPEATKNKNWINHNAANNNILQRLQEMHRYIRSWEERASTLTFASFIGWNKRIRILAKEPKREEDGNKIILSTYHAAKGLEFDVVYMPLLVEGMLPFHRALEKSEKGDSMPLYEERRLAYVGMTRAKEKLFLSWCRYRQEGRKRDKVQHESRYIVESGADKLYSTANVHNVIKPEQRGLFD